MVYWDKKITKVISHIPFRIYLHLSIQAEEILSSFRFMQMLKPTYTINHLTVFHLHQDLAISQQLRPTDLLIGEHHQMRLIMTTQKLSQIFVSRFNLTTIGGSHLITQTGILRQYIQISFTKFRSFENDELTSKRKSNYIYEPSVGIGIGSIFLKNKPVGMLLEGTIEKTLRWETFSKSTFYSLKIGIVL